MRTVETAIRLRSEPLWIEANVERDQIFRLAHCKLQSEALAEPPGEAHMVGVEMGGDDPRQFSAPKRPNQQRLPRRARLRIVDSRIDDRQPVAVFDQVYVDVIEPKRKGKARPQDARTNLDRLAWFRWVGVRKHQRLGHRAIQHRLVSSLPIPPRVGSAERQEPRRAGRLQLAVRSTPIDASRRIVRMGRSLCKAQHWGKARIAALEQRAPMRARLA